MAPRTHRKSPVEADRVGVLPFTPALLLGPYYPLGAMGGPVLWAGGPLPAGVQALVLKGRVLDMQGQPVVGAEVELWQADPAGRYRHPSASGCSQVLEGFAGHGRVRADADGAFVFHSLVPGAYIDGEVRRAPHLHLQITGRFDRLVTQLFLPGHPASMHDRWYRMLRHPDRLTPEALPSTDGALHLRWTAVLHRG